MKLNFLFISYSVIYAKYNHCFDVPKDMPTRYFDGKVWKIMKTRHHIRTKAPKPLNIISKELDWADLIREMKEIELVEPAPDVNQSTFVVKESAPDVNQSTFVVKETAPDVNHSTFLVKETTITPKNSVITMTATPKFTIKELPTQSTMILTVNHRKFTTTKIIYPDRGQVKEIDKLKDWKNMWTFIRPTVKPATVTKKKYFATTTKYCPIIRPTKQLVTTKMPVKLSGTQGEDGGIASENWSKLLKEFLKFVELKKCKPPCKPEATTSDNRYLLGDNQRAMSHDDDLMNILMDGVEIDDGLFEDYPTSQRELVASKETLEAQSQILDFEPDEGSVNDYEHEISGDNVLDGDVRSNEVTISATKKQDKTAQSCKYLDEYKVKNASDEIVKSSEIKSYFETLEDKHVKKENELSEDKGMKASSDEENYSQLRKKQDKDILRKNSNDKYVNDAENLLDFSKDLLNTNDTNEITDDMAPKDADSEEIKSKKNYEDVYQDRDITFEIESLESDGGGANKYSTERSLVQGEESEHDGKAVA